MGIKKIFLLNLIVPLTIAGIMLVTFIYIVTMTKMGIGQKILANKELELLASKIPSNPDNRKTIRIIEDYIKYKPNVKNVDIIDAETRKIIISSEPLRVGVTFTGQTSGLIKGEKRGKFYLVSSVPIKNKFFLLQKKDISHIIATDQTIILYYIVFTVLILLLISFYFNRNLNHYLLKPIRLITEKIDDYTERRAKFNEKFENFPTEFTRLLFHLKRMADKIGYFEKEIMELSEKDFRTGLYNSRIFYTDIGETFRKIKGGIRSTAILAVIDIDKFKKINDTYGHYEGDRILTSVAEMIKRGASKSNIGKAYRYGGDEFFILFNVEFMETAIHTCETIRKSIEKDKKVTVSIGIAKNFPDDKPVDLIRWADYAMYNAKKAGGNSVNVWKGLEGRNK